MSARFLLYSSEMGVYLGNCLGFGFWSKVDPAGQPAAVTFATAGEAARHVASWDEPGPPFPIEVRPVDADDGDYASIAACVAAGFDAWDTEGLDVEGVEEKVVAAIETRIDESLENLGIVRRSQTSRGSS